MDNFIAPRHDLFKELLIADVSSDAFEMRMLFKRFSVDEKIQNLHRVPAREERRDKHAPDVPRAAGDENSG